MKRILTCALAVLLLFSFGCGKKQDVPRDGIYQIGVTLDGGSGKASVASPAELKVENGSMTLTVVWSSDKYDYMIVGGETYLPELTGGHSVFVIPVGSLTDPLSVSADTTAMSVPHEIAYTLIFDLSSLEPVA